MLSIKINHSELCRIERFRLAPHDKAVVLEFMEAYMGMSEIMEACVKGEYVVQANEVKSEIIKTMAMFAAEANDLKKTFKIKKEQAASPSLEATKLAVQKMKFFNFRHELANLCPNRKVRALFDPGYRNGRTLLKYFPLHTLLASDSSVILNLPRYGKGAVAELETAFAKFGLSFGMDPAVVLDVLGPPEEEQRKTQGVRHVASRIGEVYAPASAR